MSDFMEGEYSASDVERFIAGAVDDERAEHAKELEAMREELQTALGRVADMREMAAREAQATNSRLGELIADRIRALPLDGETGT